MLKEIKNFLKSNNKFIEIKYKSRRLNAACDWHKLRNPYGMAVRGLLFGLFNNLPPSNLKNFFYRLLKVKIGKDVVICPDVLIDPLFPELIEIKDGVILGWGSRILAHEIVKNKFRLGRVEIGKGTVIGMFSLIRPGIKIGKNCIIAAMSYVNKDIKDNLEVGGVPEHRIKKLKKV